MFTGIITGLGTVQAMTDTDAERQCVIRSPYMVETIALGASIAHDGCCLTVTHIDTETQCYNVHISPHTLEHTTLGAWEEGRSVNLERALKMGDELGGHLVSGHVDGLAQVMDMQREGESWHYRLSAPEALMVYIADKGSVTLDGVSLTVTYVRGNQFGLTIIPHTLEHTTLSDWHKGRAVNLEVDMLARYVHRLLPPQAAIA